MTIFSFCDRVDILDTNQGHWKRFRPNMYSIYQDPKVKYWDFESRAVCDTCECITFSLCREKARLREAV